MAAASVELAPVPHEFLTDMPTGEQLRAARALLGIDQRWVAQSAGVSVETVKRLEAFRGPVMARNRTVAAIVRALERAGVTMIPIERGGPGVTLGPG